MASYFMQGLKHYFIYKTKSKDKQFDSIIILPHIYEAFISWYGQQYSERAYMYLKQTKFDKNNCRTDLNVSENQQSIETLYISTSTCITSNIAFTLWVPLYE